jgi:hypothetical protein
LSITLVYEKLAYSENKAVFKALKKSIVHFGDSVCTEEDLTNDAYKKLNFFKVSLSQDSGWLANLEAKELKNSLVEALLSKVGQELLEVLAILDEILIQ